MEFFLGIDQSLFKFINQQLVVAWADSFFPFITDLHKTVVFQSIAYPLVLLLMIYKFKRLGISIFLILILCLSWTDFFGNYAIKKNFERSRPFQNLELNVIQRSEAHGFSFTSNHAANIFAFATFVTLMIPQAVIPSFILAFLVAYSRIYNGVHYPSDVFFGALFGILWGYIFSVICKIYIKKAMERKMSS